MDWVVRKDGKYLTRLQHDGAPGWIEVPELAYTFKEDQAKELAEHYDAEAVRMVFKSVLS